MKINTQVSISDENDLLLTNYSQGDWTRFVITLPIRLKNGKFLHGYTLELKITDSAEE